MIGKPSGPTAGTLPLQIATTGQQEEEQRGYERGGQSNRNNRFQGVVRYLISRAARDRRTIDLDVAAHM